MKPATNRSGCELDRSRGAGCVMLESEQDAGAVGYDDEFSPGAGRRASAVVEAKESVRHRTNSAGQTGRTFNQRWPTPAVASDREGSMPREIRPRSRLITNGSVGPRGAARDRTASIANGSVAREGFNLKAPSVRAQLQASAQAQL